MSYGVMIPATGYAGVPFPRPITEDDLEDPTLYANRHDMAADLFTGGVIAELGTYRGNFAGHLLDACNPTALHLYDKNMSQLSPAIANHPKVTLHEGDSSVEIGVYPDSYYDGIYIDGDHSLEGVRRDARKVRHKLKSRGVAIFNDYCLYSIIEKAPYGICHAVAELLDEGFKVIGFAFQFQDYHDIALRAP